MKIVIITGWNGSGAAFSRSDLQKPLLPILGKPILEYQIEVLRQQGYTDLVLTAGHSGSVIKDYFLSGEAHGVSIRYIDETEPLGTAGALYYLKKEMAEEIKEDFLLLYGDIVFDINIERMLSFHKEKGGTATILTQPSTHPYDSALIEADKDGLVSGWLSEEDERLYCRNCASAGIYMLSPKILDSINSPQKMDLDRDLLKSLMKSRQLYAYASPEYVKQIDTPDCLAEAAGDLKSGRVQMKNLSRKQKAVFLDRDGTLNVHKGFITGAEEIELCEGAAEAVKRINKSGYLAVIVSNQPVIARGEATFAQVDQMMDKIETLLGAGGAYIDDRFYCPHHPERGHKGEVPELKIACSCRKPQPGLLLQAAEKYNIDLKHSYMIGDTFRDIGAGKNAGCTSYLLDDHNGNDYDYKNLLDCIKEIL